ncbi:hypothetical protein [Paraburkholderia bonniea]|uniref:hypothetical protein n=1 Tax=Paraburkholderia bonniea TaxID=2152891 RepID=UPI001291AB7B|nr:hypothetical protein [Paraburkholderia bonniea]
MRAGKNVGQLIEANNNKRDTAISTAQLVEGFLGSINKSIRPLATKYGPVPWVGAALSAAALVNDASKITTQISEGKVKKSDIYAAISDACALLGQGMLALAGLATLAAPAALLLLATPCCCRSRSSGSQHWPERGLGICRRGHCRGYARVLNAADVMMSKLGASVAEGVLKLAEGSAPREVLRQVAAAPITAAQHALIEPFMKAWVATTSGMTTIESLIAQGKRWIRQRFWVAYVNPLPDILKAIWCLSSDLYAAK